jgi:diguanylate cyclase (GGDEF)-like protein
VTQDLIITALIGVPLYALAMWYEVLHWLFQFTSAHHNHELDWLIVLIFCLGIAAMVFSVRRMIDLRREVKHRRSAEAEAHRLARLDVLTGLPNRRWFLEDFAACAEHLPGDEVCAVLVIDLDNFKPINDLYGHRLGDEVLREVAARLSRIVAKNGTVARLGGDEFGVLTRCPRGEEEAIRLARCIVHAIPKPIRLAALSIEVGVSVGVAIYEGDEKPGVDLIESDGSAVETILRQADMAMYRAKSEGGGLYRFFDSDMDAKLQQRVQLEREIKGAIEAGQIIPYYQPLVDLETSETVGYEVLARWTHPTRGLLQPDMFVSIAEDTGTIGEMTYALLTQAMHDARDWPQHLYLSINLSPRQISDPSLSRRILGLLAKASFPTRRLVVEITETAVVQKMGDAKRVLDTLRKAGVRVALDDFGTGYSGLYHLRKLQLDTIKIDRSFVSQMLVNPEEAKIVKAIVSLSRALGLHTTAEGIESRQVLERLTKLGCDTGQGFLFGEPQPESSITSGLREQARLAQRRIAV